ncbi:hypothetical protein [Methanobrevibacter sp.]|jgi:hypothetical protein|uniref:hypothetical protein n=1 Tax=Methanobrevibacter sp. TaxID=66852 RepID=UPI0038688E61
MNQNNLIIKDELPIKLFSVSNKENLNDTVERNNLDIESVIECINKQKIVVPKYEELFGE